MFSSEWNREQQPAMLHWLCDRLLSWSYVRGWRQINYCGL